MPNEEQQTAPMSQFTPEQLKLLEQFKALTPIIDTRAPSKPNIKGSRTGPNQHDPAN